VWIFAPASISELPSGNDIEGGSRVAFTMIDAYGKVNIVTAKLGALE
jgi:hypothetical protein